MGNYNDLKNKSIGLGGVLAGLATCAGVALSGKAKREKLQAELNNINHELAQKQGFFKSVLYADEIEALENRKQAILKELNNL
ncbi:MAG: hypothetical protein HDT23_05290 [Ruminococcus sp.]|nr:hypothetical protein [Ruminococcus sp.]